MNDEKIFEETETAERVEAYSRRQRLEAEGNAVADAIGNYVNRQSNPEFLILGLRNQHRTLQQAFMRTVIAWIDHLATLESGQYDLRNQASVDFAKSIVKTQEWRDKYLPVI